jgi:hypothetical protein
MNYCEDPLRSRVDRRRSARFTLGLAVQCRSDGRDFDQEVSCEAVNISSNGSLLRTAETFLPGQIVKSYIDWPARLDNRVKLYLVVEGPVIRRAGDCVAIGIER